MAQDFLAIATTDVDVEWLFNSAWDICHYCHGQLHADIIHDLMLQLTTDQFHLKKEYQNLNEDSPENKTCIDSEAEFDDNECNYISNESDDEFDDDKDESDDDNDSNGNNDGDNDDDGDIEIELKNTNSIQETHSCCIQSQSGHYCVLTAENW